MSDLDSLNRPPHCVTLKLEATKTWALRAILWHSRLSMPPADDDSRDGTLTVEQFKTTKLDCTPKQRECNHYAIEETWPEPGVMGRQFWVLNLDDKRPDVYKTTVGPMAMCTCDANKLGKVRCKHMDGLKAIIDAGCLPARALRPEGGA